MEILSEIFGIAGTNCYIVRGRDGKFGVNLGEKKSQKFGEISGDGNLAKFDEISGDEQAAKFAANSAEQKSDKFAPNFAHGDIVIDPGDGAWPWIAANCEHIAAVLLTHGHFDHIFDAHHFAGVAPVIIHADDAFLLASDPFGMLSHPCNADILAHDGDSFEISGYKFTFHHFAGHTPGCCMIECAEISGADDGAKVLFSGDFLFAGSIGRTDFPFSDSAQMAASLRRLAAWQGDYAVYPGHGAATTLKNEQKNIDYYLKFML